MATTCDYRVERNELGKNMMKLLAVGDDGVGKTALLMTHCCRKFPAEFIPNVSTIFFMYKYIFFVLFCSLFFFYFFFFLPML